MNVTPALLAIALVAAGWSVLTLALARAVDGSVPLALLSAAFAGTSVLCVVTVAADLVTRVPPVAWADGPGWALAYGVALVGALVHGAWRAA